MYRTHEMRMVQADASGLEQWACPTCGRRILLRWPPAYEKRVLDPGDQTACHVGATADTPHPPDAPATTEQPLRNRRLRETGIAGAAAP
ncbi:hypothetical protein [Actinomadura sp. 6K520]|uniref:hypothetical protein n=1 Tax=Actinomadura sp. 6K520 TaxID=2530364 RepID=UPI0010493BEE|nr:hypothetical protein [Actinomadura sp. 6K520]TDE10195.1 hypothetical protein E1289_37670 [Actinomadura sp. 6K520]